MHKHFTNIFENDLIVCQGSLIIKITAPIVFLGLKTYIKWYYMTRFIVAMIITMLLPRQ